MSTFVQAIRMIRMIFAFWRCGPLNAWQMATQTNGLRRVVWFEDAPDVPDVISGEVIECDEPVYLLPAPED